MFQIIDYVLSKYRSITMCASNLIANMYRWIVDGSTFFVHYCKLD